MKLLILSDSHSNANALQAIWQKVHDSDYILFAGDMVDCGIFPKETVQWFMKHRKHLYAIKGNHDELILSLRNQPRIKTNSVYSDSHQFTVAQLSEEELDFLESLPREITFTIGDTDFYMCHTTDEFSTDVYLVEKQLSGCKLAPFFAERFASKFPDASSKKRVIIYGHSHLLWAASAGENCTVINPGSVSHQFIGGATPVRCAEYMVLEDGKISLCHADYTVPKTPEISSLFADSWQVQLAEMIYGK